MVYGRYNELVNGGHFMVYKPTYNWGAPSCTVPCISPAISANLDDSWQSPIAFLMVRLTNYRPLEFFLLASQNWKTEPLNHLMTIYSGFSH